MLNFSGFFYRLRRSLAWVWLFAAAAFPTLAQTASSGAAQPPAIAPAAQDEISRGVKAFKSAHYDEAVAHFQKAVELDPGSNLAKLYLATALAQNVVPGLDTPENLKAADQAINMYEKVLENDPHNVIGMKQIAGIYFYVKKLDDAKAWQKKVLAEDPNDADAAYTIGVIDWTEAHRNALHALQAAGLNDDGRGNLRAPASVMQPLQEQNGPLVEEALQYLQLALKNRPNYDDAMQYLNLVYRKKADLDRNNKAALAEDLAKASEWTRKAMATRKANEARKSSEEKQQDGTNAQ
jgi:tetratricopeptide (TPR) repeat protein